MPLPPPTGITASEGAWAALTLLVVQNVVSAFCMGVPLENGERLGLGWPMGLSLLASFVVNAVLALTLFRPVIDKLRADTRWRTPPRWGMALGTFALAFLASRAFVLAYVTLFPEGGTDIPQFISRGNDVVALLLAAGLLIPLAEEIAFRGLMMRGQERAAGFGTAALATSAAFAFAHGAPASVAGILPLAYVLARLVQASGSLWNSVIVHALNNTLAIGMGLYLMKKGHLDASATDDLLSNPAMRVPLGLGSLLFGTALMVILYFWLTPRPDAQERSAPGVWAGPIYLLILLFGVGMVVWSIWQAHPAATHLQGAQF